MGLLSLPNKKLILSIGGQARTLEEAEQTWKEGPSDASEPAEQSQPKEEKFDWLRTWYPLAIERDLPTDRPTSARLLGNAIVLWKDGDGQWRAFKDLCPHRSATSYYMTAKFCCTAYLAGCCLILLQV